MVKKCEGAKKATIEVFNGDGIKDVQIISDKPPVEYEIKPLSPCWEYGGNGLNDDCTAADAVYTSQHRGKKPSFQGGTVPQGQPFGGCSYSFVILNGKSRYPDLSGGGASGTTFVRAAQFDDSCDNSLTEAGFKVTIKDSSGEIFNKFYPGDKPPSVKVACDEQCPPHHIRCESNNYPGYCCIPCAEIAGKVNNLASKF